MWIDCHCVQQIALCTYWHNEIVQQTCLHKHILRHLHYIIVTGLEFYTYSVNVHLFSSQFNIVISQSSIFLYHVAWQFRDISRFNHRVNYPSHFRNRLISSCENVGAIIVQYCWHFGELQVVHKHKLKWPF